VSILILAFKGFTLVELLIVLAVLGVLAAVVLIAINPLEQMARGRDAGRKSAIAQLGRAVQSYDISTLSYPTAAQWTAVTNVLASSGDLKVFPTNPNGVTACTNNPKSGYCYSLNAGGTNYIVYSHLESKSESAKTGCGGLAANTWYFYSSADGKAGTYCNATEPTGDTAPFGVNLLP
jgi:prepilin-type N-terminal cleavage/methylation domain-containing protein